MAEKDSKKYLAAVLSTALCSDTKLLVGINEHLVSLMKRCNTDPDTADVWHKDLNWLSDVIEETSLQVLENTLRNQNFMEGLNLGEDDS